MQQTPEVREKVLERGKEEESIPSLPVNLDACVATVVLVHSDLLFPPHTSRAEAVFFGDADVLTRVAVVSTGWRRSKVGSGYTVPSSVLDSSSFVSRFGDFGTRLRVLVGNREDAERDTAALLGRISSSSCSLISH